MGDEFELLPEEDVLPGWRALAESLLGDFSPARRT
jgi:hypothetical protein